MPLTDDDFVKTGKLEGYSEMIQKLHEEEQIQPEITYDLQLDDDEMKKKMIEDLIETGQYKEALQYLNDMDNEQVRYQRLVCYMD